MKDLDESGLGVLEYPSTVIAPRRVLPSFADFEDLLHRFTEASAITKELSGGNCEAPV